MTDEDDNDKALFRQQFGHIRRIDSDRAEPWREKPKPGRRRRMEVEKPVSPTEAISTATEPVDEDYRYRGDGIQNKLYQRLSRGQMPPEEIIDLHGLTREQALNYLQSVIPDCQRQGQRCILVIHGKGYQSTEGKPVLKPAVAHWLRQMGAVLAFCPAPVNMGGSGALLVLLKRSD